MATCKLLWFSSNIALAQNGNVQILCRFFAITALAECLSLFLTNGSGSEGVFREYESADTAPESISLRKTPADVGDVLFNDFAHLNGFVFIYSRMRLDVKQLMGCYYTTVM